MNSVHRVARIIALAFAVLLIVLIVQGGLYLAKSFKEGFDVNIRLNEKSPEELLNDYKDSKVLYIALGANTITLNEGEDFNVTTNNEYVEFKNDANSFVVVEKNHKINSKKITKNVDITVPKESKFDKVVIKNGAGTIKSGLINTKKIDFDFGAGSVVIDNLKVEESANINTGTGEVSINNGSINNMKLSIGVGEVNIKSFLSGQSDISCGVGELNLRLVAPMNTYSFDLEKGVGSIKINNKKYDEGIVGKGTNTIKIEGGVGSVNIMTEELEK